MSGKRLRAKNKSGARRIALTIAALFVLGSLFGWTFELFLRRIGDGAWMNPGMLKGTYLPIYGVGLTALYALAKIPLPIKNERLAIAVKIPFTGLALTAIEYVGGLIFVKGMGLPLWDYSHSIGNVQGLICPLCSLMWTALGGVYLLFLHRWAERLGEALEKRTWATFLLATVFGIIIADFTFTLLA